MEKKHTSNKRTVAVWDIICFGGLATFIYCVSQKADIVIDWIPAKCEHANHTRLVFEIPVLAAEGGWEGEEAPVDSPRIPRWAHVPVSTRRIGVVKCGDGKHTRGQRPVALLLFGAPLCVLESLNVWIRFAWAHTRLENYANWQWGTLSAREELNKTKLRHQLRSGRTERFTSTTLNDSSIYSHVSLIKQRLLLFFNLSAISGKNAALCGRHADKIYSRSCFLRTELLSL